MNEIMSIAARKPGKAVVSPTGRIVFVRDAGGEITREQQLSAGDAKPLPLAA